MPVSGAPDLGQMAPDFTLKGPGGQPVSLSDHRGRKVVLVFYPLAFSPVCSHQLPEIQKSMERFADAGAVVLGISVDSHYANQAFARKIGVSFPLLSDFDRKTSAAYGVLDARRGYSGRAVFAVDTHGRLGYQDVSPDPDQVPSNDRLIEALQAMD